MPVVYSYERVSSTQQVSGRGLARQSDAAQRWAQQHGLELDQSLDLSDQGRSASKGHHLSKGALGRFLALAQSGRLPPDPILLVEAVDRLSRQEPLDAIETILTGLLGSGVRVVTLEDGAEYSRETLRTDPTRLLVLVVKMQAAYEYSARLAARMRDSWAAARHKLEQGILIRPSQFCPAWCHSSSDLGFTVNEVKAAVVRRVFDLLLEQGAYTTAKQLNADGLLTPAGNRWTAANVRALAMTDSVYGTLKLNSRRHGSSRPEQLIDGLLPVIVPREQVMAVRAAMQRRAKASEQHGPTGQRHWIGQGLSWCTCGARIGLTLGGTAPNRIRYLRCHHRVSNKDGCTAGHVHLVDATAHLLRRLEPAALTAMVERSRETDGLDQQRDRLKRLEVDQQELRRKTANLEQAVIAAAEAGKVITVLASQLEARQADLRANNEQIEALKASIHQAEATSPASANAQLAAFREAFAQGDDTCQQRQAVNQTLRAMGLRITIDGTAKRMGLQLGDGPVGWQTIRPLDRRLLWAGQTIAEEDGLLMEPGSEGIR